MRLCIIHRFAYGTSESICIYQSPMLRYLYKRTPFSAFLCELIPFKVYCTVRKTTKQGFIHFVFFDRKLAKPTPFW